MTYPEVWTIKMADLPHDDFVRLSAYKALDMQRAEMMVENARLKAEVDRLRKAGDAMLVLWKSTQAGHWAIDEAEPVWNAAKDGKPSV